MSRLILKKIFTLQAHWKLVKIEKMNWEKSINILPCKDLICNLRLTCTTNLCEIMFLFQQAVFNRLKITYYIASSMNNWKLMKYLILKETCNSFKKWSLNLWWISNKTIIEVENIAKAVTFNSFLHLHYKNTQLLFLWQCFLIFSWDKY